MKVILVVRDGWGHSEETAGNAVLLARTPNSDRYMETYPWTLLNCTGNAIGVPEGTQGGSEPGHLTMGAGRVVWQPLEEINRSIKDGSFYSNDALNGALDHVESGGGKLHLMGLLSDQGIHGTTHHLGSLLELASRRGLEDVYIHCFLDGRDVPERSAKRYLSETLRRIEETGVGRIASLVGRYYAMDRDTNWERTQRAYDLLTLGEGCEETDVLSAIEHAYERSDDTDYYIEPIVITDPDGGPVATVDDGDSVVFWNFRSDRARQITYALTDPDLDKFPRRRFPRIRFTCMSVYDQHLDLQVAFPQRMVENNLGQVLSARGLRQLRIAETEKYAHVTFFFNSQVEDPNPGEERILVPSPKVPSYEEKPEMSAPEITDRLIPEIRRRTYDFILVNYANGDLVGHSANLQAGIEACEAVDRCIGRVVEDGLREGYAIIVTGDHGNIETMFYPDGSPNPSHGLNPVPFILIGEGPRLWKAKLRKGLGLSSVAPTILDLMGLPRPNDMTEERIISEWRRPRASPTRT
ncbi:MAG: 2,3-bisphosphoglycerate-independent phosphoglycerate mutase [Candidatus Bathyarchaeota archaeon]|nr:MAG: 2,3-bisphosphoglycerate-independent phosphoglycerate mutase [Candidatus Bathyarchaeota archaeon]